MPNLPISAAATNERITAIRMENAGAPKGSYWRSPYQYMTSVLGVNIKTDQGQDVVWTSFGPNRRSGGPFGVWSKEISQ